MCKESFQTMGTLRAFKSLFIAPHYSRDDALRPDSELKESKCWRSWRSGGVEGEASLLGLCYKMVGSRFFWSIQIWDLVLNRFLLWFKSNWVSCKDVRFLGKELSLWIGLTIVESSVLEVFLKILSGSSTILGGFGSEWDLVLILCEAIFQTHNTERLKVYKIF